MCVLFCHKVQVCRCGQGGCAFSSVTDYNCAGVVKVDVRALLSQTACSLAQSFCPADFQGCSWNGTSNFKLLGAPVGSDACRRIGKARALLSAIGRFPDSLLRSCSGWSKVLYSCRTVTPDAQMGGLRTADSDLRVALGQLIGRPLSVDDWRLAPLGVAAGGLGARCAAEHAPAAYVASFSACRELRGQLRPALDALRGAIPSGANFFAVSDSLPRSPSLGWSKLSLFQISLGTPPFPDIAVCILTLAGYLVLGLGLLPTRRASIPTFLPLFSAWLSSAVFECHCGIATRLAACAGRFPTAGEITPLPVAVVGIGFCATTPSEMWSAPRSLSSLRSHLSLRSLASFSPRGPPILVVLPSTSTPPLLLPRPPPPVAALPMYGFPGRLWLR